METASDPFEEAAEVYTRLVRQENQEAGAALDQIQAVSGSQAALRAALIITIFNEETQRYHLIPDIRTYAYLLKDYQGAIPLLEEALNGCLESKDMPLIDNIGWGKWQKIREEHRNAIQNPLDNLVQRVRHHSPITAVKLEALYEHHGLVAGDYAATALIWFQARIDRFGSRILIKLTDQEIQEFTYFQYMGEKEEAIESFVEMLECFRIEHLPTVIRLLEAIPVFKL
ncbi:MAG: hypothetical protein ABI700_04540 [Chloroflexota bacterium]